MPITVLGICGSPVKGGNTEAFLNEALKAAAALPGVTTRLIRLADKNIGDCTHCNWCVTRQTADRYCQVKDDMSTIYPELINADVIMMATPVYFARLSRLSGQPHRPPALSLSGPRPRRQADQQGGLCSRGKLVP